MNNHTTLALEQWQLRRNSETENKLHAIEPRANVINVFRSRAAPLDTKRSAQSAESQYRLVCVDAREARGDAVLLKGSARSTGPAWLPGTWRSAPTPKP